MVLDSIFKIGATHQVCQDYAWFDNDKQAVALSDGCSGSPHTDFGSRLLVRGFLESGQPLENWRDCWWLVGGIHTNLAAPMGLNQSALDATLFAAGIKHKQPWVFTTGDGYVLLKYRNGKTVLVSIEFESGYPNYLSYICNQKRFDALNDKDLNVKTVTYQRLENFEIAETLKTFKTKDLLTEIEISADKIQSVLIFSDGLGQFQKRNNETNTNVLLKPEEILKELTDFKVLTPNFLHRRWAKFSKYMETNNIKNLDDFSCGAIIL
jgi:hypothetical protein